MLFMREPRSMRPATLIVRRASGASDERACARVRCVRENVWIESRCRERRENVWSKRGDGIRAVSFEFARDVLASRRMLFDVGVLVASS